MKVIVIVSALALDYLLGEPKRHPLVFFGQCASALERAARLLPLPLKLSGVVGWFILVVPLTLALHATASLVPVWLSFVLDVSVVYVCVAFRSLAEHARAVRDALNQGDMVLARRDLALFVSRDTQTLSANEVAAGATESVLENGSDAVVATLFWYVILGPAGALGHRLANTLDAMWGYRSMHYAQLGWCAARMDDLLNWVPARICALAYCVVGQTATAWRCWREQAPLWDSPNAGPVMASGAGALGLRLGGDAAYGGEVYTRPHLGEGIQPTASSIDEALRLLSNALLLLVLTLALAQVFLWR